MGKLMLAIGDSQRDQRDDRRKDGGNERRESEAKAVGTGKLSDSPIANANSSKAGHRQ